MDLLMELCSVERATRFLIESIWSPDSAKVMLSPTATLTTGRCTEPDFYDS